MQPESETSSHLISAKLHLTCRSARARINVCFVVGHQILDGRYVIADSESLSLLSLCSKHVAHKGLGSELCPLQSAGRLVGVGSDSPPSVWLSIACRV